MGARLSLAACALVFSAAAWAGNNAQFVSQSVIHTVGAGKSYAVSVTFKNTGTTPWTAATFKLGSQNPADNWNWNNGRVTLDAGETVAQGATKTFNFNITAQNNTSSIQQVYNFQWRMLQEGVAWFGDTTPNVPVEVFYTPSITTNFPPSVPPAPVSAADFAAANFLGANVLETSADWFPSADQMRVIANMARAKNLNFIRFPVAIPPNGTAMQPLVDKVRQQMDIAHAYGLRVIVALDGYDKYSNSCDWRGSFISVDQSAAALVGAVYSHPALFAWDLNNEPMWYAASTYPSGLNPGSTRTINCLYNGASDYQQVVDGIHAMYNLVRANDPSNKPTTVGEMQIPFVEYWKDISSFASPHLYVSMNPSAPDYTTMRAIVNGGLRELKRAAGTLPVVIGEFGFNVPGNLSNENDRATAFSNYYQETAAQGVGTMFWNLSTGQDQQPFSPLDVNGVWKAAGGVIGQQRPLTRNSEFVSQSVPATMQAGHVYPVSITLKNTGNTNWGSEGYKLGSQNPADNTRWGLARVLLNSNPSEIVLPGQTKTFTFNVTAPSPPGSYPFQWQVLQEGVAWFGATTSAQITVQ
jgi:hypothetical protein